MKSKVKIHTDGGCRPTNPGPGGWAAVIDIETDHHTESYELFGFEENTTNNRMELTAISEALKDLQQKGGLERCDVKIFSDSSWSINSLTGKFKSKKNRDLLDRIISMIRECSSCEISWVKGHADNEKNNRCDNLVKIAVDEKKSGMNHIANEEK